MTLRRRRRRTSELNSLEGEWEPAGISAIGDVATLANDIGVNSDHDTPDRLHRPHNYAILEDEDDIQYSTESDLSSIRDPKHEKNPDEKAGIYDGSLLDVPLKDIWSEICAIYQRYGTAKTVRYGDRGPDAAVGMATAAIKAGQERDKAFQLILKF